MAVQGATDRNEQLRRDVGRLFANDLGYRIQNDFAINGYLVDYLVSANVLAGQHRTLVQCWAHDFGEEEIRQFGTRVAEARGKGAADEGCIVTSYPPSKAQLQAIARDQHLRHLLKTSLEDMALGLSHYVERALSDYEVLDESNNDTIPMIREMSSARSRKYYVDLSATASNGRLYDPIDSFIDEWLAIENSGILSVAGDLASVGPVSLLGSSGSGKTSFCLHLVYKLSKRWKSGEGSILPLYVPLAGCTAHIDFEEFLFGLLVNRYRLKLQNAESIHSYAEAGRFLLIFDGFDEMCAGANEQQVAARFAEIAHFAKGRGKVLITCRSHYFRLEEEAQSILSPTDIPASELLGQASSRRYATLDIEELRESQILAFLSRHPRIGNQAPEVWARLQNISNLGELATRPLLLGLIVEALPYIQTLTSSISPAQLYRTFVTNVLDRERSGNRIIGLEDKDLITFLKELSLDMLESKSDSVRWTHLPSSTLLCRSALLDKYAKNPDFVDYDTRNCFFLDREGNEFRFIHSSFKEFFAALQIAEVLLQDTSDPLVLERCDRAIGEDIRRFVLGLLSEVPPRDKPVGGPVGEMIHVRSGPYISGGYNTPLRVKAVSASYFIAQYPVTWAEYEEFEPNRRARYNINSPATAPVSWVSWDDAMRFCAWLAQRHPDWEFRLPTADEWERAVRGIDGRIYPWGDEPVDETRANFAFKIGGGTAVDKYPKGRSYAGLMDAVGNLAELTETSNDSGLSHVYCGGGWDDAASQLQCATRRALKFGSRNESIGFRLVCSDLRSHS